MTVTPETDNLARGNHVVPTEFAEQLERELATVTEQRDRLAEALEYILGIGLTEKTKAKADKALQSLTKNTMTNEQIWRSRAEAHEENYLHMLKRIDDVISERDEAIRSCHIWQKGHAELVTERDYLLNLLQVNQPERKHIGRWGHNRQEFTSPYINNSKQ